MKKSVFLFALLTIADAQAETPSWFIESYSAKAATSQPGFSADAARGKAFASHNWGVSDTLANCTSCHTSAPVNPGRHVVTGKTIAPLSPTVNPERFSNPAKVEKWFRRNCKEVVGRACTPAEKADFIAFAKGDR